MSDEDRPASERPSLEDTYMMSGDVEVSDEICVPFDRFDRIYVERDGVRYEIVADGDGGLTVVEADE